MFEDAGWHDISNLNDGDVVAIFSKTTNGSPVPKSWGSYDAKKNRLK
jgi:hypothetical protein